MQLIYDCETHVYIQLTACEVHGLEHGTCEEHVQTALADGSSVHDVLAVGQQSTGPDVGGVLHTRAAAAARRQWHRGHGIALLGRSG